jgi:hypothetical protein
MPDDAALVNCTMVCAYVGEDGSATAFRAIARSILNFITGEEKP